MTHSDRFSKILHISPRIKHDKPDSDNKGTCLKNIKKRPIILIEVISTSSLPKLIALSQVKFKLIAHVRYTVEVLLATTHVSNQLQLQAPL